MAKRLNNGQWFQLFLIGICLVICLLSAGGTGAQDITPVPGPKVSTPSPKVVTGPEALQPIYLSPEQIKGMGPAKTSVAPISTFKVPSSSIPQPKPLTELPDWVKIKNK